jgi:hypothetical protein
LLITNIRLVDSGVGHEKSKPKGDDQDALAEAYDLALVTASKAQTGKDLLTLCICKNAVEQISCNLCISGFVHGRRPMTSKERFASLKP